jgi:hypothetical protein
MTAAPSRKRNSLAALVLKPGMKEPRNYARFRHAASICVFGNSIFKVLFGCHGSEKEFVVGMRPKNGTKEEICATCDLYKSGESS